MESLRSISLSAAYHRVLKQNMRPPQPVPGLTPPQVTKQEVREATGHVDFSEQGLGRWVDTYA